MRRHELTDRDWAVLQPLLDEHCKRYGGGSTANHLFINAILWRIRTGVPWRDLPERLGKWNSLAKRFARWAEKKVWQRLFTAIQEPDWEWVLVDSTSVKAHPQAAGQRKSEVVSAALGRSKGGLTTKIHAAVDALGNPVHVQLSGGKSLIARILTKFRTPFRPMCKRLSATKAMIPTLLSSESSSSRQRS